MNKTIAIKLVGSLGHTTKMPCKSYGLAAVSSCNVGGKLAKVEGTICNKCYAARGMYLCAEPKKSHVTRLASIEGDQWVEAMITLIGDDRYFRWHDSGDVQDAAHFTKIVDVCKGTPKTKHWMPTRERAIVEKWIEKHGPLPPNLVVRMSAVRFDEAVKPIKGTTTTSGSHWKQPAIGHECPAPQQNGNCGDCRACWDKRVKHVSYHKH